MYIRTSQTWVRVDWLAISDSKYIHDMLIVGQLPGKGERCGGPKAEPEHPTMRKASSSETNTSYMQCPDMVFCLNQDSVVQYQQQHIATLHHNSFYGCFQ